MFGISYVKQPNCNIFVERPQDLEAKVMLDRIGKELMKPNILFLTIHDAVLVNNDEDCNTVQLLLPDAFQTKFGIAPSIKRK